MAGITGIGSGVDIDAIVTASVAAEKAPKQNQIDTLEKKTTTKLTSLGSLKSAVSEFQTALALLNSPTSFLSKSATSSNTSALSATGSASAVAGSYKIEVSKLASGSKIASAAITGGSTAAFNTGTLDIKLGGDDALTINVDSTNNTLAGVRDAINAQGKTAGITATIVSDSQGSRLVLSSSKMGDGNDITMTGTSTGTGSGSLEDLTFPGATLDAADFATTAEYDTAVAKAGKTLSTAASARMTIDGLEVVSDSNTIDKAVDGITIKLTGVTKADEPLTLTVADNTTAVKTNVQNFVTAYNKMMSTINSLTKVTTVTGSDPVVAGLAGDSTARSLVSSIRNELVSNQTGGGAITALANLGITTKQDGTLEVNTTKLDTAISDNYEGVAAYFTGDEGLATRLTSKLKPYTDGGGILESRTTQLTNTISGLDKQQEALDLRMTALQTRLYKQYNAMDALVSQLTSTSSSLTAGLDSLPGLVKKS
ncbi:flagellar filament capping protein FliD [Pseudomonas turukhanskensis]|uniref:Flagellar hook-associated protein 2 n=1 Tax=Pseudomonas turukhanskensis TaxID=1806536 RepID=A0A9W6K738_9PSED|nr:flagellar filament capping protein FliD [Pseudomonas turukhanskensis]GLK89451.1 B-type flagellar hook-associated protein 2 [Pseudomonas turukhanskensis]